MMHISKSARPYFVLSIYMLVFMVVDTIIDFDPSEAHYVLKSAVSIFIGWNFGNLLLYWFWRRQEKKMAQRTTETGTAVAVGKPSGKEFWGNAVLFLVLVAVWFALDYDTNDPNALLKAVLGTLAVWALLMALYGGSVWLRLRKARKIPHSPADIHGR